MRLGIKKIEALSVSRIKDFSFLPDGCKFHLGDYISGTPEELPFIVENVEYNEDWVEDSNGKYSNFSLTGLTRKKKEEVRPIFNRLVSTKNIYIISFIDGQKAVVGSKEFIPKFKFSDSASGISKTDLKFTIELQSLHGVLWDTL